MSYDIFNPVTAQNPYTYAGNTPIRLIDLVGGLSSDPLNPSWTTPCINQNSVSPTSKSLSGGAPAAARTLIHTGDLREEYTRRSSQIPIDISNEEQSAIRTHLKEEIRSRSNFFAKACLKEIDRKRELKKAKARSQGQPSPYRKDHAQSTNKGVNRFGKFCQNTGRILGGASILLEVYNIASAPAGEKLKETTRATGRMGSGYILGTYIGAELGALGLNPITVFAGMVIGGATGAIIGENVIDLIWSQLE